MRKINIIDIYGNVTESNLDNNMSFLDQIENLELTTEKLDNGIYKIGNQKIQYTYFDSKNNTFFIDINESGLSKIVIPLTDEETIYIKKVINKNGS